MRFFLSFFFQLSFPLPSSKHTLTDCGANLKGDIDAGYGVCGDADGLGGVPDRGRCDPGVEGGTSILMYVCTSSPRT